MTESYPAGVIVFSPRRDDGEADGGVVERKAFRRNRIVRGRRNQPEQRARLLREAEVCTNAHGHSGLQELTSGNRHAR